MFKCCLCPIYYLLSLSIFFLTLHLAHAVHGVVGAHHHRHLPHLSIFEVRLHLLYLRSMSYQSKELTMSMSNVSALSASMSIIARSNSQCRCPCTSSSLRCGWSRHCCTRPPPGNIVFVYLYLLCICIIVVGVDPTSHMHHVCNRGWWISENGPSWYYDLVLEVFLCLVVERDHFLHLGDVTPGWSWSWGRQ